MGVGRGGRGLDPLQDSESGTTLLYPVTESEVAEVSIRYRILKATSMPNPIAWPCVAEVSIRYRILKGP